MKQHLAAPGALPGRPGRAARWRTSMARAAAFTPGLVASLVIVAVAAGGLAVAVGSGRDTFSRSARADRTSDDRPGAPHARRTRHAPDASRFILGALLVPAFDGDTMPLRWVDALSACGPEAAVVVDGAPLRAGAPVPDLPFQLDWVADDCRPFGAQGPRLDGRARLMVFREDWGFSASVEPADLRFESADGGIVRVQRGSAIWQPVQYGDPSATAAPE